MDLWRLTKYATLDGQGGRLYPARWNSAGAPIVYLSESAGSALVEVLIHLELEEDKLPNDYQYPRVLVPNNLKIPSIRIPAGDHWKSDEPLTRKLGDAWLKAASSALVRVPSAVLPETYNYLLNPLHPDAASIRITHSEFAFIDPRLLKTRRL